MPENDSKISELEDRLDRLVRTQIDFQKEISAIRSELVRLHARRVVRDEQAPEQSFYVPPERHKPPVREPVQSQPERSTFSDPVDNAPRGGADYAGDPVLSSATASSDPFSRFVSNYAENARVDLEKFIGENLISKIGIVVLVLGVGIGAKYAIDNNLISPLARIIVAYIFGFGLVGLAIKLKPKYHNFSAVLISGGMAIMYFVTYFAYSAYSLISQMSAFALMAMFTVFTVTAAVVYSRQVIAHIGLVGAYAVPFLLSNDSGNYLALFIYIAIVNSGILAISVKKAWRSLFYTSSAFTWIIFYAWFVTKYFPDQHFELAIIFLAVFFTIFYATKLIQKTQLDERNERDNVENLVSTLVTGLIFYGFCLAVVDATLDTSRYWTFFSYLAVVSIAILTSSFRFYGRFFLYLVVPAVWATYAVWYLNRYDASEHFYLGIIFASLFFTIFYFSILFYRLVRDNFTLVEHTSLVLSNSFIFYGFGYSILNSHEVLRHYLGLYTAANAGLHLGVSHLVNKIRPGAVDVVQLLTILVLTFASISIPVQFDGNFVTMIWSMEAALLFWFGRTQRVRLFEYFSYPVMALAAGSLLMDWAVSYSDRFSGADPVTPLANGDFVTGLVFVAAFAFIFLTNRDERYEPWIDREQGRAFALVTASLAILALYNVFRTEIGNYHYLAITSLGGSGDSDRYRAMSDLRALNIIWQLNYTMAFLAAMSLINLRKLRSSLLGIAASAFGVLTLEAVSTVAMFLFQELRENYMAGLEGGTLNITIRYISYAFAGVLLYSLYKTTRDTLLQEWLSEHVLARAFEAIVYSFIFIAASCELVNLMGQLRIPDATKLGLSILWGVYALVLIGIGIAKDKKYLRIAAFVLLAVTLMKLFFYDIADLGTIPKTILFVTLGITLLVISFLYNKFTDSMFKREAAPED